MKKDKSAKKAKAEATESQPEAKKPERNADDYLISLDDLTELKSVQKKVKAIGDFLSCIVTRDLELVGIERFPMELGIMLKGESGYMESILEDVEKEGGRGHE